MLDEAYAVETRGLTRRFGRRVAVDHLDLQVRAGELEAVLQAARERSRSIVLDLSRVAKVDQAAIDILVRHAADAARAHVQLEVVPTGRGIGSPGPGEPPYRNTPGRIRSNP